MLKFSVFHRFYLQLSDFVVFLSCKYVRRDIYKIKNRFIPFCPESYKF